MSFSSSFVLMALVLGLTAVPVGLYIRERNEHVPEASKVFTRRHLRNFAVRTLARVR